MIHHQKTNRISWLIIAILSFIASITGVITPTIYQPFVKSTLIPGLISQDLITILAAGALLFFSLFPQTIHLKKLVLVLGILGYLFYGYGIYVIEQFYNVFYPLYMGIFGLSFYSIIAGITAIDKGLWLKIQVSRIIRIPAASFLLLNPMIFYPLWIAQILPFIQSGQRPDVFYSIYILDMCFIMPAMAIVGIMALKNKGWGLMLLPALLIKGYTLLFSVALGGSILWIQNQDGNIGEIIFYLVLSFIFLGLAIIYLHRLKIRG